MKINEITDSVYYVGVNDRVTVRFEAMWPLPYGVSYNSYLVRGKKTALIDGVKIDEVQDFLKNIDDASTAGIDYLVVNHTEPDHSGAIPEVVRAYPDIRIVGNAKTVEYIKGFCKITDDSRFLVVKDGDTLDLGGLTLRFALIPMVHWPETMVTYLEERNLLFSGDAFGAFGALNGAVVDRDMDTSIYYEEMYRYYSNIVGKYGRFVTAALAKLKDLKLDYICPTHGPVWHDEIAKVVEIYRSLAAYESEPGVVIVYGSMYGNTGDAAEAIARALAERGEKKIIIHNAAKSEMSDMIRDAFRYRTLIVGSCTYSMRLFPPVEMFMNAMETREIRDKVFGVFGSFTWAPNVTGGMFAGYSERMKLPIDAAFSFRHAMGEQAYKDIDEFADSIIAAQNNKV